jgi:hypothetical protein
MYEGGLIGRRRLNPALARRAVTQLGDVWVVPGNGYIALDVGGMGCNRTEVAASRGMVTWTSARGGLQDLVHGLVPDGVEEVTLLAVTNAATTVIVNENVYAAVLNGRFRAVRFLRTDRSSRVPTVSDSLDSAAPARPCQLSRSCRARSRQSRRNSCSREGVALTNAAAARGSSMQG